MTNGLPHGKRICSNCGTIGPDWGCPTCDHRKKLEQATEKQVKLAQERAEQAVLEAEEQKEREYARQRAEEERAWMKNTRPAAKPDPMDELIRQHRAQDRRRTVPKKHLNGFYLIGLIIAAVTSIVAAITAVFARFKSRKRKGPIKWAKKKKADKTPAKKLSISNDVKQFALTAAAIPALVLMPVCIGIVVELLIGAM